MEASKGNLTVSSPTRKKPKSVPLSLLEDIGSLLYALVHVFHPDWLVRSNFRLRRTDNLHKDSLQNSWIYSRVKTKATGSPKHGVRVVVG